MDGDVERAEIGAVGLAGSDRQGRSDGEVEGGCSAGICGSGLPSSVQVETVIVWVPPTRVSVIGFCGMRMWTFEVLDPVVVKTAGCAAGPTCVTRPVVVSEPLTGSMTAVPAPRHHELAKVEVALA